MNLKTTQCPCCGEDSLHPRIEHNLTEINGQSISLPLHYSVCDHCGVELTNVEQSRDNKRVYLEASGVL